jgi:hypothetical protein
MSGLKICNSASLNQPLVTVLNTSSVDQRPSQTLACGAACSSSRAVEQTRILITDSEQSSHHHHMQELSLLARSVLKLQKFNP